MIKQPSDWICICDMCGDEISSFYDMHEDLDDFVDMLEGQDWHCVDGEWYCPRCYEDYKREEESND